MEKWGSVGPVWDFQGWSVPVTTFLGSQLFPELGCSVDEGRPSPRCLSLAAQCRSSPRRSLWHVSLVFPGLFPWCLG